MVTTFGSGPGTVAYLALRRAGAIMAGATEATTLLDDCLMEANLILDGWDAQKLAHYFMDDRYFDITVSQQTYTLGPTGDFDTDADGVALLYRPQKIELANYVYQVSGALPVRIPLNIIEVDNFAQIPLLQVQSNVTTTLYIQYTDTNITLWPYPYPNTGNQFEFFMWPGFARFASVAGTFTGPPAFTDALVSALALKMYQLTTRDVGIARNNRLQTLMYDARAAHRLMTTSNLVTPTLDPDIRFGGNNGAPFNYLTGTYSGAL